MAQRYTFVHAGLPFFGDNCRPDNNSDHPCPLPLTGDLYMSGEFFIVSSELARIITSNGCPNRSAVTITSHEDVTLSNLIFHCAATVPSAASSTVQIVPIRWEQVLRSNNSPAGGLLTKEPHRFFNTLWAHSTTESGGYYKNATHYRQVWKEFVQYWSSTESSNFPKSVVRSTIGSFVIGSCCPQNSTADLQKWVVLYSGS